MCALMKKIKKECVYIILLLHLKFHQLYHICGIEQGKSVRAAFFFLIVKHSRNLYTSDENLGFDLKIPFKECECIF